MSLFIYIQLTALITQLVYGFFVQLFSCIVPGRVLVFCTMAYQYFRVTDPLSETTPFLRLCCYPDSVKEFQRTREVCPRLEAPNELTGASGLGKVTVMYSLVCCYVYLEYSQL